jgi:hypothetical protein
MFVREIFVSNGWHEMGLNGRPNPTPTLFQGHCEKTSQCVMALDLAERMPIVMPLRHPYRVEESWKRRGEDTRRMLKAYINMLDGVGHKVSVWFPIDSGPVTRAFAHGELNEMADKALTIDWDTLVNAEHNTHAVDISMLDPSAEIRHIRSDPLFVEYYGATD